VALAVVGVPLLVACPWLAVAAVVVAAVWSGSLLITLRRSERDLGNDLVLAVLAVLAVPLVWLVGGGASAGWRRVAGYRRVPGQLWLATAATGAFLFGSVLHVKSLLREAGNVGFRRLSVGYHVIALAARRGFAVVVDRLRPGIAQVTGVATRVAAGRDWGGRNSGGGAVRRSGRARRRRFILKREQRPATLQGTEPAGAAAPRASDARCVRSNLDSRISAGSHL
jgi:hypothetical protein